MFTPSVRNLKLIQILILHRRCRKYPRHELLGARILEGTDLEPTWRCMLRLEDVPWINDHRVGEDVVFPAAGYVAMAGEATRQLSSVADYTLQNFLVQTALVLKEGETTEIVTSLRASRLTDSLESSWYDFSITSFSGTWMTHCSGQIKAGRDKRSVHSYKPVQSFPRSIESPYDVLKSIGLNYGTTFQGLTNTTANPGAKVAAGSVLPPTAFIQDHYQLHPTSIDSCIQLFMLGACDGVSRRLDRIYVPTKVGRLYIGEANPLSELQAVATATTVSNSLITGHATAATKDGNVVLELTGGHFSAIDGETAVMDNVAGAELYFAPDIDLYNPERLIRPREDPDVITGWLQAEVLCLLCMIEIKESSTSKSVIWPHLDDFISWVATRVGKSANDNDFIGQAAKQAASMNSAQRLSRIDELSQTISASKASPVSDLVRRVFDNHKLLLQGHVEPLEVLLPNDGLTKFYNVLEGLSDYHDLFATLGHNDPGLRVLEVGAGTGGTSSKILNALRASNGTRMYSKYCYTDISSGFFIAAKKRFEAFSNIEFSVLDISKDPISQGFPLEGFDIIIAANVLHATPSINSTLKNFRKLIAPNGRLYLQELSPSVMSSVNFIMGILPGWWLGKNDNRLLEPYITSTRWDRELRDAGFLGTETVVHDDVGTYHLNANIIAQPAPTLMANGFKTTISVLGDATKCYELDSLLRSRGYQLEYFSRCDQVPPGQDIISTLELSNPFFDDISAQTFSEVQALAKNLQNGRLLWLTKSSQKDCVDPNYGLVLGLARTLRAENSVDFNTLEIDDVNNNTWAHVVAVFDKIRYRHTDNTEQDIDPDYEFVLSNGVVRVGRYHAVTVPHELPSTSPKTAPKKLKIGKLGLLQSLSWEQQILLPEIGEDDLEVEPQYVGLNFRVRILSWV
jgi:SAM-dependent methyltransferase